MQGVLGIFRICITAVKQIVIEEDKKIEFYKGEYIGAPLSEYIGFRCTKRLLSWLTAQGDIKGRVILL